MLQDRISSMTDFLLLQERVKSHDSSFIKLEVMPLLTNKKKSQRKSGLKIKDEILRIEGFNFNLHKNICIGFYLKFHRFILF